MGRRDTGKQDEKDGWVMEGKEISELRPKKGGWSRSDTETEQLLQERSENCIWLPTNRLIY